MAITLGLLLPIGSVIHSMLTESQFQSQIGSGWVLADGRSATGTVYNTVTGASTIPDMRGTFLRAKDNGVGRNADGDLSLGTYTDDKFESHLHRENYNNAGNPAGAFLGSGGAGSTYPSIDSSAAYDSSVGVLNTQSTGSNETAPKSTIVNIFIRIN